MSIRTEELRVKSTPTLLKLVITSGKPLLNIGDAASSAFLEHCSLGSCPKLSMGVLPWSNSNVGIWIVCSVLRFFLVVYCLSNFPSQLVEVFVVIYYRAPACLL